MDTFDLDNNTENLLDELGIYREHIIAVREAYTQTNKKKSPRRAKHLLELFHILQDADAQRNQLFWDEGL